MAYEQIDEGGIRFVFKYDEDAPELLHIFARHLTTVDDALDTWLSGDREVWNAGAPTVRDVLGNARALFVLARGGEDGHDHLVFQAADLTARGNHRPRGGVSDSAITPDLDRAIREMIEVADRDVEWLDALTPAAIRGRAPRSFRIEAIEGIGRAQSAKLREAGIRTVEALLERGATTKGRDEIEQATGVSGTRVLRWVNHADLFRINGVAGEMSELLEAAGVDTVAELARRNPQNLHQALTAANEQKKLVRQLPSEAQVTKWVEEAKSLPRVVNY